MSYRTLLGTVYDLLERARWDALRQADERLPIKVAEELEELEPVMVVLGFHTEQPEQLMEVLARYVVLSRGQPGCRNIDYVASITDPGRLMVVEKWESAEAQRAHFDSPEMVAMATQSMPLLDAEPDIDLFEGISMHDLA
ncbi:MAG: putative quinol monooxygenase [Acidimicrobiales bacterium]